MTRQRGGGMDDHVDALQRALHAVRVADIAVNNLHAVTLRVVERRDIERDDTLAPIQKLANHVDAIETGAAGDEIGLLVLLHRAEWSFRACESLGAGAVWQRAAVQQTSESHRPPEPQL